MSREFSTFAFSTFALGQTSPIVGYLRRLAAHAHAECGGPGVGAVGMCLTGGFALAMAVDERMIAPVLGLRFTEDRGSPPERFDTLRRELGDSFLAVEIDSSPGNPHGIPSRAHSVLTGDLVDRPGHPTHVPHWSR